MNDSTTLATMIRDPISLDSYSAFAGFKLFGTSAALVIFSQGAAAFTDASSIPNAVARGNSLSSPTLQGSYLRNSAMTWSTALPLSNALAEIDLVGDAVRDLLYQGRIADARSRLAEEASSGTGGATLFGYALALKEPTTSLDAPGQGSAKSVREYVTKHNAQLTGKWAAFNQDGELLGSASKRIELLDALAASRKLKGALLVRF